MLRLAYFAVGVCFKQNTRNFVIIFIIIAAYIPGIARLWQKSLKKKIFLLQIASGTKYKKKMNQ